MVSFATARWSAWCTTVVEVGIDVPEATIIVVVAAERYGLAQLRQLRGRVGRGEKASRCCLVASSDADEAGVERLAVLRESMTGAAVAECRLAAARARRLAWRAADTGLAAAALRSSNSRPSHHRTRAPRWLTTGSGAIRRWRAGNRKARGRRSRKCWRSGSVSAT